MNNLNQMANYAPRNQISSYLNPATGVSTPTNNIIWVQGIEGAKAWQLSPNSIAILLDSEADGKMYIKVSDNIGMTSLRVFNYVEELPSANKNITKEVDLSQYVKRDELESLIKELLNEQSISTAGGNESAAATKSQPKIIYPKSS